MIFGQAVIVPKTLINECYERLYYASKSAVPKYVFSWILCSLQVLFTKNVLFLNIKK